MEEEVTVHHGRSLISEILGGDGVLEEKSSERVVQWLFDHGAKNPRNEIDRVRARRQAEERKTARCVEGLPDKVRQAFTLGGEGFDRVVQEAYPSEDEQIRVLLRILGADNGPWNRHAWQEQIADGLLRQFPATKLGPICEKVLLSEDRQARRGAARVFESFNSPLNGWTPVNAIEVHRTIIAIEADARSTSVRQRALRSLRA